MASTANGELAWFDLATGRRVAVHATSSAITSLSVSANGHEVAASDATQAVAWTPGAPRASRIGGVRSPGAIAISPSGRLIAVLETTRTRAARLVVRSADGSEHSFSGPSFEYDMAGFPSESSLVLFDNTGPWRRLDPASLQTTAASDDNGVPANSFTAGAAQDGSYAGYVWFGQVNGLFEVLTRT